MSSSADSRSRAGQSSHQPVADTRRIVDTLRESLLVVGDDRRAKQLNPASYEAFASDREATIGECVFSLGGRQCDQRALRGALTGFFEEGPSFERGEIDRIFGGLGRRVLQINGRSLRGGAEDSAGGDSDRLLLAIIHLAEERRLEEVLRRQTGKLEQLNKDQEPFAYAA